MSSEGEQTVSVGSRRAARAHSTLDKIELAAIGVDHDGK